MPSSPPHDPRHVPRNEGSASAPSLPRGGLPLRPGTQDATAHVDPTEQLGGGASSPSAGDRASAPWIARHVPQGRTSRLGVGRISCGGRRQGSIQRLEAQDTAELEPSHVVRAGSSRCVSTDPRRLGLQRHPERSPRSLGLRIAPHAFLGAEGAQWAESTPALQGRHWPLDPADRCHPSREPSDVSRETRGHMRSWGSVALSRPYVGGEIRPRLPAVASAFA